MAQLLGIDLGTTNTKAIIFDELGNLLSQGLRRTPTHVEGNLRATYDAEAIWQTVALVIRDALEGLGGRPVVGRSGDIEHGRGGGGYRRRRIAGGSGYRVVR